MHLIRQCMCSILLITIVYTRTYALESRDIIILIISQENAYNFELAQNLKQNIIEQAKELNYRLPLVHLSHEDFPHVGDWTVLPILPQISSLYKNDAAWLFICNERTNINLNKLIETLNNYNCSQEIWVGYALFDKDVTIIHHFAFYEDPTQFLYPNMGSGFAVSMPLLQKTAERFSKQEFDLTNDVEFSIDCTHELALFIWDKNSGINLTHDSNFCINYENNCATHVTSFSKCGEPVPNNSVYFAIKTCKKFHETRVSIVLKTWGKYIENINFFSDIQDTNVPTISFNIPNTEYGHCEKTFAIIKHVYNELQTNEDIQWVVITDDDTILSPSRLYNLLSCYKSDNFVALGERYGYKVQNMNQKGYNYITGGGGTVLSAKLVQKIVQNSDICSCTSIDSPDDMFLGVCLSRLGVKITHSPHFHQARPNDYSQKYLSRNEAISFHKHWMIDPEKLYSEWFGNDDEKLSNIKNENVKTEL